MGNEAEYHFALAVFFVLYAVYSIRWAFFEQFIFDDRQFHVGAANFFYINGSYRLVKGYHGAMAVFFLVPPLIADLLILNHFGRFVGLTLFFGSALWLEDMFYYVGNKFDKPDGSENITSALGFIGKVPVLWIAGLFYTCLIVWWRVL